MQNKVHFIAGLPRSGSTLLAAILRQNPAFSAEMSGPVGNLYKVLERGMCRDSETSVFITPEQRRLFLKGLFTAFYHDKAPGTIIFDTNRTWTSRMAALAELFPNAKVICCVRSVPWIIDSLERQVERNPFELSRIFGFNSDDSVYSRAQRVTSRKGFVGISLDVTREACFGSFKQNVILLDYEALTRAPADVIAQLYKFLGEPLYDHDFNNVHYEAEEFDTFLGAPGLHTVRGKVEWRPRESILPPDLFQNLLESNFWWRMDTSKVRSIIMRRPESAPPPPGARAVPPVLGESPVPEMAAEEGGRYGV